jgi:hypothetical protein
MRPASRERAGTAARFASVARQRATSNPAAKDDGEMSNADTIREAIGAFDNPGALEKAVSELASAGFDRSQMSLLARDGFFDREVPAEFEHEAQAADEPGMGRRPVVSDSDLRQGRTLATSLAGVVAAFAASGITILTGGAALTAITAAAAAGGGAVAVAELVGQRAGKSMSDFMKEQIERGGILLWVTVRDAGQERTALEILRRHAAADVHVHDSPAGS